MSTLDRTRATMTRRVRRGWVMAATLTLALTTMSCSGDDSTGSATSADPTSTTRVPTTATTTTSSTVPATIGDPIEDEIISRYLGFWDARLAANGSTPDPDDPALREFATGAQLDNVIAETQQRRDDGLALRAAQPSRSSHTVTVVSASGERAELQDCFVNDGVVYRPATGEVVDDSVVTRSVSAVMVSEVGTWKLERATVIQEWEGVAGCALAD